MGEAEERVRALHRPHTKQNGEVVCFQYRNGMDEPWPCDVIQALDEAKQELEEADKWQDYLLIVAKERDGLKALVEQLRAALELAQPWIGAVNFQNLPYANAASLAVTKALALTPEAALAELEVKRE